MSDTPRTDKAWAETREWGVFHLLVECRRLEREFNAVNAKIAEMEKNELAARIRARIRARRWRLKNAAKIQRKPSTARHKAAYHAGWQNAASRFKRWDEIEDSVVMEHKKPDRELSAELGRSVTAIQQRRVKLKQRNEAQP
jgi:hypothetical protein